MNKVFTTFEVAELLKLSRAQVFKLLHSGDLHSFRIGRQYRITESQLQDFVNRCCKGGSHHA